MRLSLKELSYHLEAELVGDGLVQIDAVGPVKTAGSDTITFITDEKHRTELEKSEAAAVISDKRIKACRKPQLVVKNVNEALIKVLNIFAPALKAPQAGIDPTARIGQNVKIAQTASVGPYVVIEDGVEIGDESIIGSCCRLGQNSKISRNCRLDSNVVIYHNCTIGNNVIIQANTTIGSTGFGYFFIEGSHRLIPHNGTVVIEDFVEIGACCCIDRAKFGETRIGAGTKIDNLVQIAHNVHIGRCCLIAGMVGIAGSSRLGDGVVLAGQVGVVDNVEIGDGVMAGGQSMVSHNIPSGQKLFGSPAVERSEAFKMIGMTRRLPKMYEQLKELGRRIENLEGTVESHRRLWWVMPTTAAAAVFILAFFLSPLSRYVLDPHEYKIEQIVRQYQDGDDNFYVSSSSRLEDLHSGKTVFVITDIAQAEEIIAANQALSKDSFFIISYKDLDRLRRSKAFEQLSFITEVDVEGTELIVLSTEKQRIISKPKV